MNDDEVVVLLGFQHLGLARVVTVLLYRVKCNQVVLNTHDYKTNHDGKRSLRSKTS